MKRFAIAFTPLILLVALFLSGCKKDEDTTPPEITIQGFNPYTVCVGSPYFDQGATASDDKDGDLTGQIDVTINVDTSKESEGTVTYKVTDSAGNQATAVREVKVIFCD